MAWFSSNKQKKPLPGRRQPDLREVRSEQNLMDIEQRYNFRRNRTLTGSSSSQVASATEGNAQLKSARVQAHELIKKRRRIWALLGVAGVSAFALYGLITQFTAQVVVLAPSIHADLGKSYVDTIQLYYATKPIERLRFLTNQASLESFVKERLPEVNSVQVGGHAGFGVSDFILGFRQPLAGWALQNKQQYVDDTGTAFSRNYYPVPAVQIVDNSGIRPESGQTVVASNRFLAFVGRTVGLVKVQGLTVTQVVIPAGTTRQVELHIEGKSYPIKLSIDRKVGEQVEDMSRTIHWFDSRGQTPQYIDVRVGGKAFYR